ncbi:collagen alpha-1(I) chain-like isoform X2 [Manacus candei]|uniref:collagen alpha-1(I) chain-like isoform X2 n=1 Tax=Manacus candei TaxID=415023 RepID=UPI0022279404|nr:collagen alpha-1(I) chain-like isoform X2 [Manacus candei]
MVEKDESGPGGISEEEAAQYDRQIRLWGLEAQKRLRASRVLLVGLRGLGAEVAKNLILAGVRGVTLLDHRQVSQDDPCSQFLVPVPDPIPIPGVPGRPLLPVPGPGGLSGPQRGRGVAGPRAEPEPHGGGEGRPRERRLQTTRLLHPVRRGVPDVLLPGVHGQDQPDLPPERGQVLHRGRFRLPRLHVRRPGPPRVRGGEAQGGQRQPGGGGWTRGQAGPAGPPRDHHGQKAPGILFPAGSPGRGVARGEGGGRAAPDGPGLLPAPSFAPVPLGAGPGSVSRERLRGLRAAPSAAPGGVGGPGGGAAAAAGALPQLLLLGDGPGVRRGGGSAGPGGGQGPVPAGPPPQQLLLLRRPQRQRCRRVPGTPPLRGTPNLGGPDPPSEGHPKFGGVWGALIPPSK